MTSRDGKSLSGVLYIVATPIGNREDITYRAVSVLRDADIVAAEDTRNTARLLSYYGITTPLISCHEHNEEERAEQLAGKLRTGQGVALVSDAGTPSVSDPGYRVILAAIEAGIQVVPIPGASAPIAALSVSGLPSDTFCFAGFLPKKKGGQGNILNRLASAQGTLILYESPKRLEGLLKTLLEHLGDRQAMIAREMTKPYEEFLRGSLSELLSEIKGRPGVKGEITVLVSGRAPDSQSGDYVPPELYQEIKAALSDLQEPPSRLAAKLAGKYRIPKNRVYRLILDYQKKNG